MSPKGGSRGNIVMGGNSAERVVAVKVNILQGGSNNNCGGHPQEENEELFFNNYFQFNSSHFTLI